jgi:hypothetical protein
VALPANVWVKTGVTTDTNVLMYNGALGVKKDYLNELTAEGHWCFDAALDTIFIYSATDPDTAYTNPGVEASQRTYAVFVSKDSATIQDLDLRCATITALRFVTTDTAITSAVVDGVSASFSYEHGIEFSNSASGNAFAGGMVKNSISHHNGRDGIRAISQNVAYGDISDITVQDNTVYSNNWRWDTAALDGGGIKFCGPYVNNIIVQRNTIYNNGDLLPNFQDLNLKKRTGHGIHFDTMGANSIARYNRIYHNNHSQITAEIGDAVQLYYNVIYDNPGGMGISVWSWGSNPVTNTLVYNNTCYGNYGGIAVWGENTVADDITGNIVKNNILAGNTFAIYATEGGENDGTKGSGNVYEYNALGPEAANFITWGAATPDTYDAWETAYGGTTHSVEANPLFVSTVTPDFRLQSGSPCINAGTDVSLTTDYAGNVVPKGALPDIGAYEWFVPIISSDMQVLDDMRN